MNCKKCDLAIVIRSLAGNEGIIVRCVDGPLPGGTDGVIDRGPRWRIDRRVKTTFGITIDHYSDAWLRPLRDAHGEDEMLRVTGKPEELVNQ